jgi:HSF-type DNA-binding
MGDPSWCTTRKSFNDKSSLGTCLLSHLSLVHRFVVSPFRFGWLLGLSLCSYFRQTKYSSFQRQLNIYEFQRISTGPDKNAYYHLSFQRGKHDLLPLIKRVTVKGTGIRKAPSPENEPDFYQTMSRDAGALSMEAPPRPVTLPSFPMLGLSGSGALSFPNQGNLTTLDLLSQLNRMGGLSQTLTTSSMYPPTTSLDLGFTLRRAQQILEESQLRDAWTRLSALEQMRNRSLLGNSGHTRTAAVVPPLVPPTSESLLQQFLLKNGSRQFS